MGALHEDDVLADSRGLGLVAAVVVVVRPGAAHAPRTTHRLPIVQAHVVDVAVGATGAEPHQQAQVGQAIQRDEFDVAHLQIPVVQRAGALVLPPLHHASARGGEDPGTVVVAKCAHARFRNCRNCRDDAVDRSRCGQATSARIETSNA